MMDEYVVGMAPKDVIPAGAGAKGEFPLVCMMSRPANAGLSEL
jgi:hypothetical protein